MFLYEREMKFIRVPVKGFFCNTFGKASPIKRVLVGELIFQSSPYLLSNNV